MKKINFRQTAVLPSACLVLMMGLSAAYPSATEAPFPVVRLAGEFSVESAWKNVSEISVVSEGFQGTTQFQYDDEALYIRTVVRNSAAVFAPAEAVSKEQCRLYEYDSMEFWLGRHQFTIGIAGECAEAFDYTAGRKIDGAEVLFKRTPGGYEIVARLPWAGLPSPHGKRELLILSVWFNRVLQQDGKALRSALKCPATVEWDRPVTYGAAFLNDNVPLEKCAATLAPLVKPAIKTAAFLSQDRLILRASPTYGSLDFRCTVGKRFAQTVRSGEPPVLVALPMSDVPEISRIDLAAVFPGGNSFGPISLEYFSHGPKPLTDYRSNHEPPKDFDEFWDARLAELAREPMRALKRRADRPSEVAELWEVTLQSWRGVKIVAYVSVPKAPGKYPLSLWVYPAGATEAKDVRMSDNEVVLDVHPRGFGASEKFSPKPSDLYVSNVKTPEEFHLAANIMDVIRGIDFAVTLDQVDSRRIFVGGGSRGGYLTLALAANDPRIAVASARVPCYADVDMMGRLGFASAASDAFLAWHGGTSNRRESMRNVWSYFDAVNLAHRIHCPIVVEAGMTDTICAAPGIVDTFNRMASPRKFLLINPEQGHTGTKPGGDIASLLQAEAGR